MHNGQDGSGISEPLPTEDGLQYRAVLRATGTTVFVYDVKTGAYRVDLQSLEPVDVSFSGRSLGEELLRQQVLDAQSVRTLRDAVKAVAGGKVPDAERTVQVRARDGQERWFRVRILRMDDRTPVTRLLIAANDIQAQRETTDALRLRAERDALTGLYNRETFFERSAELIRIHKPGHYVMACFDIDNFKVINDQYGSDKGDHVLRYIADVFQKGFSAIGGICCRVMADNFAVLYPCALMQSKEIVDIRERVTMLDGSVPPITFSIGRYLVNDPELSVSAMYDRASIAENRVKGRFDVHIAQYDESMRKRILDEQEIINEMNRALAEGDFLLYLQPQYNHGTGAMVGAEALVRWLHPQKGLIPPTRFVPVFERNGFIYELDKYVWEQTCILLRRMLDAGQKPLPLSVNVSRYDVFRENFFESLTDLLKRYRLPVSLLRLEITESAFAHSSEQIIGMVKKLTEYGFVVEIDDFGSGYSSFNTLKDVPANILKLDMRFLEDNGNSTRGGSILESIVRMAKWLDMPVIAEDVETREQADYLLSIGCNLVQGYLYAEPMPAADYERLAAAAVKEPRLPTLHKVANLDNEAFWDPASMDTLIFNSYVGGACIFEYHNGGIELLRANDKYAQVIGSAGMTVSEALRLKWEDHLDAENRRAVHDALMESIRTGEETGGEFVFLDLPGCPRETYLHTTLRVIAAADDRYLIYCMNENITAQRTAERKERETERRRSEAAAQLRFLNDIANDLLSDADSDEAIGAVLHKILHYFGGARTYIIEVREQTQTTDNTYEVCAPGVSSEKENLQNIPNAAVPFWFRSLEQEGYLYIPDVDALGPDGAEERRLLAEQNIRSLLAVPLRRGGKLIGFVGVDDPTLQQTHIDDLKAIGDYLAVMLTRRDLNARIKADSETLRNMMNDTPGGFVRMRATADGGIATEYVNEGFCHLRGMTAAEILSADCGDALRSVHPDDVDTVRATVREMYATGETQSLQYRLLNGSGSYIWLMVFGRMTRNEAGDAIINAYFTDVSEKDTKELSFRETVPFVLEAIMESSTDLAFAKDKELRYLCGSRPFAHMLGLSDPADVVGKTDYDLFDRAIADKYRADDRQLAESGQSIVDKVEQIPSDDGVTHYSSTSKYLLRDAAGEIVGLYGVGRDITEYRESFARLKLLTDNIPGGIAMYELSPRGIRLLYCSDGFITMNGYTREQYMQVAKDDPTFPVLAEDLPVIKAQADCVLNGAQTFDYSFRTRSKDGSLHWNNLRGNVSERRGDAVLVNAVKFDVTELKRSAERLRVREQEYRLAIVHSGKLIYRYLHQSNAVDMPQDTADLFGMPPHMTDMPDSVLRSGVIAPESKEAFAFFFRAMQRGDHTGEVTVRRRIRDGSFRWFTARFSNVYGDDGKPVSAIIVFEDITSRHEQEDETERLRQSEQMLRTVVAHSNRRIYRYDFGTHTAHLCSPADTGKHESAEITGLPGSLVTSGVVLPESQADYRRLHEQMRAGCADGGAKIHMCYAGGAPAWMDIRYSVLLDDNGKPVTAVVSLLDITDAHEKELAYERYRQTVIESAPDESLVYFETDLTADVVERKGGNVSHVRFPPSGCSHKESVEYGVNSLLLEEERERARTFFARDRLLAAFAGGTRNLAEDWLAKLPDGTRRYFRSDIEMLQDPYSGHVRAYILLRDVTEETQAAMDVKKQAETDGMTGLYNKTTTETLIRQALARTDGAACALLVLDLDDLKSINDRLGHAQGDCALRLLADSLRAQFRRTDVLGRVGGDEFVVFLDGIGSETMLRNMLLAFGRRLALSHFGENNEGTLHASIGAAIGKTGDAYEQLFGRADRALYHVKRNGKNDFAVYTPDMEQTEYRYQGHTADTPWQADGLDKEELGGLLHAISAIFPLVVSVNLTQNSYKML